MTAERVECRRCGRTVAVVYGWCSVQCYAFSDACNDRGPRTAGFLTCELRPGHDGLHEQGDGEEIVHWSSRAKEGK